MSALTSFYTNIKQILEQARCKPRTAVNTAMAELYLLIGKRIVEGSWQDNNRAQYGKRLLENLLKELVNGFGRGFPCADLHYFCQFYLVWSDQKVCCTLCSKLSWSHNRLSVCQLERNIKAGAVSACSINQDLRHPHLDFIKAIYVLGFLQLSEGGNLKESKQKQAII